MLDGSPIDSTVTGSPAGSTLDGSPDGDGAASDNAGTGVRESEALPHQIGRYVILRQIGQGGMGVVFAAYDSELERRVALKCLRPSRRSDSEGRGRILREAQALARLSHPNVLHIYEVCEAQEQSFIAMEFVDGTTLREWQSAPQRTNAEILEKYLQAAEGLQAAHAAGIVHRDFKADAVAGALDRR